MLLLLRVAMRVFVLWFGDNWTERRSWLLCRFTNCATTSVTDTSAVWRVKCRSTWWSTSETRLRRPAEGALADLADSASLLWVLVLTIQDTSPPRTSPEHTTRSAATRSILTNPPSRSELHIDGDGRIGAKLIYVRMLSLKLLFAYCFSLWKSVSTVRDWEWIVIVDR